MAIVRRRVISDIRIKPDRRIVEIQWSKQIYDDVENTIIGLEDPAYDRAAYQIGVDDNALRVAIGSTKANLLIANL